MFHFLTNALVGKGQFYQRQYVHEWTQDFCRCEDCTKISKGIMVQNIEVYWFVGEIGRKVWAKFKLRYQNIICKPLLIFIQDVVSEHKPQQKRSLKN